MPVFFVAVGFFAAGLALIVFLGAAGFFVATVLFFLGEAAFFTFGVVAFFVAAGFFAPAGLAAAVALALLLGFTCLTFFVVFDALPDLGVALDRGLLALAMATFFGLSVVVAATVEVLGAVVIFFAGLVLPADFERARFFVPAAAVVEAVFLGLLVFFFVAVASAANLNDPLAPLPFVCFKCLDLTPFFKANLRC